MTGKSLGKCEKCDMDTNEFHDGETIELSRREIIYGIEDRPPWTEIIFLGIQHFSVAFSGCLMMPLLFARFVCFDLDRELLNQLLGTSFFIGGVTTILQTLFGSRLPIIQGCSAAFTVPAIALFTLEGPCPAPLTSNSTVDEREYVREIAFGRMQLMQGCMFLASIVQFLIGFTGAVGTMLRFIRPITITTVLLMIALPLVHLASDLCGVHWGISSICMFFIVLFSQFLDKYPIPLPGGRKYALFTYIPILLSVSLTWIICWILTSAGVFSDDPMVYGYGARTDIYKDVIRDAPWIRFPYPGQFGLPTVTVAGFIGMLSGILASIIESFGDYHACALLCGVATPPKHAINRGVAMEGLGCMLAGLWGAVSGYTSYSNNVSIIPLTKVASRVSVYSSAVVFIVCGLFFKFNALVTSMPEPIYGAVFACTAGMVATIGFTNLSFIKFDTSRNLFILGFAIVLGLAVPDYLNKNPSCIQTGSVILDQVLTVLLGNNLFLGGTVACVLDNLVRGTPEEKGTDWRARMTERASGGNTEDLSCYDLPFGMGWIRRTYWTRYVPFSPTFKGFGRKHRRLNSNE